MKLTPNKIKKGDRNVDHISIQELEQILGSQKWEPPVLPPQGGVSNFFRRN